MKYFLKTLQNTFYNRDFYHDVLREASLEKAFLFYLKCGLVLALGVFLSILISSYSFFTQDLQKGINTTLALYPNELNLTFNNGELVSNMSPLVIPLYQSTDTAVEQDAVNPNVDLVIDTSTDMVDMTKYSHGTVLFGKKFITVVKHNTNANSLSEIRQYPYAQFGTGELVITKTIIESYIPKLLFFVKIVFAVILILGPLFFAVFKLLGLWVWALILGLMFWVLLRLMKHPSGYKGTYVVALYTSIPALIITMLISIFFGPVSLIFSLVALFTFLVNFLPRKSGI